MIDFMAVRCGHADQEAKQVAYLFDHPLEPLTTAKHIPMMTTIACYWQCWKVFGGPPRVAQQIDLDRFSKESIDGSGSFPYVVSILAGS